MKGIILMFEKNKKTVSLLNLQNMYVTNIVLFIYYFLFHVLSNSLIITKLRLIYNETNRRFLASKVTNTVKTPY